VRAPVKNLWVRSDGQRITGNASLELSRSQSMGTVGKGCMAQHGYLLIPETESEQKLAEFAAANKKQPVVTAKKQ
jgi:hypothetical protein